MKIFTDSFKKILVIAIIIVSLATLGIILIHRNKTKIKQKFLDLPTHWIIGISIIILTLIGSIVIFYLKKRKKEENIEEKYVYDYVPPKLYEKKVIPLPQQKKTVAKKHKAIDIINKQLKHSDTGFPITIKEEWDEYENVIGYEYYSIYDNSNEEKFWIDYAYQQPTFIKRFLEKDDLVETEKQAEILLEEIDKALAKMNITSKTKVSKTIKSKLITIDEITIVLDPTRGLGNMSFYIKLHTP